MLSSEPHKHLMRCMRTHSSLPGDPRDAFKYRLIVIFGKWCLKDDENLYETLFIVLDKTRDALLHSLWAPAEPWFVSGASIQI